MKTIEEAAYEHLGYQEEHSDASHVLSFKAGIEFVQRWVPIEEDSPEYYIDLLIKTKDEEIKLARYDYDGLYIGLDSKAIMDVASWRPIEYK